MKLLPVSTICRFLGKKPDQGQQLMDFGLPVARIPGESKHTPRVVPSAFIQWMAERLGGTAQPEDVERDLRDFLAEDDAGDQQPKRRRKNLPPAAGTAGS